MSKIGEIKQAIFLIIGVFLVFSSLAEASDFAFSGYTELGKRSTADDYDEEDTDDEYNYQNYHLKLKQDISDELTYDISSFIYDKNYKSQDSLDSLTRIFKTNWSYYFKKESLKTDFKLQYKEKRYKNTPTSEYDQIRLEPSLRLKDELYAFNLACGIDNYNYLDAGQKDQFKYFGKIGAGRFFLDRKLMLTSDYKIEEAEQDKANLPDRSQAGRKKTKHEVTGGIDYLFELPLLYKITNRVSWGQRDTKDDDDRDVDYDYEYWRYYTKTEHKINLKLKTSLKYQFFKKDYVSADLDNRGFYIQNGWDYEVLDDKNQRLLCEFELEHKDVAYGLKNDNDYLKETVGIEASYQRKKNAEGSASRSDTAQSYSIRGWKASAGFESNFYDFNDPVNDKKRYYTKLSFEKLFLKEDLSLGIDFKYRYTDYEQKDDTKEEAIKISLEYRF